MSGWEFVLLAAFHYVAVRSNSLGFPAGILQQVGLFQGKQEVVGMQFDQAMHYTQSILKTAFASTALKEVAEAEFLPKETADKDLSEDPKFRGYDLAIFDRCAPKGMPSCNTIVAPA